jgi:hypothetical protein
MTNSFPDSSSPEAPGRLICKVNESFDLSQFLNTEGGEDDGEESIVDNNMNVTKWKFNVSNCNKYEPEDRVEITSVDYDSGVPELNIGYKLYNVSGTVNVEFFYVESRAAIATVVGVADGTYSIAIAGTPSDGDYYLYAKLSTGIISLIFPFKITTAI